MQYSSECMLASSRMIRCSSSVQLCSTAQRKYSCVGTSSLSISPPLRPLPYIHGRLREQLNFLKVRTGRKALIAASAEETRLWTEYFSLRLWYFFFLSRNYVSSDSDVLAACLFFSNSLTSLRSSSTWWTSVSRLLSLSLFVILPLSGWIPFHLTPQPT